jgi:hypothetical protein
MIVNPLVMLVNRQRTPSDDVFQQIEETFLGCFPTDKGHVLVMLVNRERLSGDFCQQRKDIFWGCLSTDRGHLLGIFVNR